MLNNVERGHDLHIYPFLGLKKSMFSFSIFSMWELDNANNLGNKEMIQKAVYERNGNTWDFFYLNQELLIQLVSFCS